MTTLETLSSTSSSERRRLPLGLACALAWLFAFELAARTLTPGTLPGGRDDRELAYRRLVPDLLASGAPAVSIVGSSRTREALNSPVLAGELDRHGGVRVGNFSIGGAQAEEIELVVARLLEASPRPTLVVWGTTPRDLATRERPSDDARYLWRVSDWWQARADLGGRADPHLPDAIVNELSRASYLVRYRFGVRALLEGEPEEPWLDGMRELFFPPEAVLSPMRGALSFMQRQPKPNKSRTVTRAEVVRYLAQRHKDPEWPNTYQVVHVERALARLERARVPVLVVELPLHPALLQAYPPGTVRGFRKVFLRLATQHGAPFVRLDSLDANLDLADFREQSHLNLRGAKKFTRSVAPAVASALAEAQQHPAAP